MSDSQIVTWTPYAILARFFTFVFFLHFSFLYLRWAVLEISGAGPDLVTTGN